MRVGVVVSGSRGDVQPMLAVAIGLRDAGHDAIFCSSPDNETWARSLGCPFESVGEALRGNRSLGGWGFREFDPFIRRQVALQVRDLPRLLEGCDTIVASGLTFGAGLVAQHLAIPYRYVSFTPASFLGTTRDSLGTRVVRRVAETYADVRYGSALAAARRRLGLARAGNVMRHLLGVGTIAATDPALTVAPDGSHLLVTQTGYPLLAPQGDLSKELRLFLDDGPPPIYAGFGSMPVGNGERMGRLLVEAAELSGQRLVISRGWGGIADTTRGGSCLFVDDEPHDRLFPRVRSVIHHGGAGTVATAARAGVPQIILPAAADQFLWRRAVVRLGLGPPAPMLRLASARSLARAITAVVAAPVYLGRAEDIAARLADGPDGVATTVAEITRTTAASR
jgi:vancomycin aglycone glucosyltransferase